MRNCWFGLHCCCFYVLHRWSSCCAWLLGLFGAFDENLDSHIDFKEMACGISACCRGPMVEKHKCKSLLSDNIVTVVSQLNSCLSAVSIFFWYSYCSSFLSILVISGFICLHNFGSKASFYLHLIQSLRLLFSKKFCMVCLVIVAMSLKDRSTCCSRYCIE